MQEIDLKDIETLKNLVKSCPRPNRVTVRDLVFHPFSSLRTIIQILIRGYSDEDLWDLGPMLVHDAYPKLVKFYEGYRDSYPTYCSSQEWEVILRKIVKAFALFILLDYGHLVDLVQDVNRLSGLHDDIDEGFRLFGENLGALWL
jgi:hypothetical protein